MARNVIIFCAVGASQPVVLAVGVVANLAAKAMTACGRGQQWEPVLTLLQHMAAESLERQVRERRLLLTRVHVWRMSMASFPETSCQHGWLAKLKY